MTAPETPPAGQPKPAGSDGLAEAKRRVGPDSSPHTVGSQRSAGGHADPHRKW
jgi:hypothetical protein